MELPVYVINRDTDTDRLQRYLASASRSGISPTRIAAFDAHAPDFPFHEHRLLIGDHFWGRDTIKPGAIGCFLSHRRAWELLLASGNSHALICEDDTGLTPALPDWCMEPHSIADADIVFANTRLAGWAGAVSDRPLLEVGTMIALLEKSGGPRALGLTAAPGADAYLLSRAGAQRMLRLTAEQRIVCGVDWALIWNSLSETKLSRRGGFPELEILSRHLVSPDPPLRAVASTRPLARQVRAAPSTIRHAITRPIASLFQCQDAAQ